MKEPEIGTERIAELLEGRLGEPERTELLARLARSDDDLWVFLETSAVLGEAELAEPGDETADPQDSSSAQAPAVPSTQRPLPPSAARPGGWRRRARWYASAAVLATAAVALGVWWRGRGVRPVDPGSAASLLAHADAGLPAGWIDSPPWEGTLGAGDALPPQQRAIRAGALHTDLLVAHRAGEEAEILRLRARLDVLLASGGVSGVVTQYYDEALRADAGAAGAGFARAGKALAGELGAGPVRWGAWAETARLAAARRDAAFFRARETRSWVREAGNLPGLPEPARDAAARLDRLIRDDGPPEWAALQRDLRQLIGAAAS